MGSWKSNLELGQGRLESVAKYSLSLVNVGLASIYFSSDLGESFSTATKKNGGVCLRYEEQSGNQKGARESTQEAHNPSPTRVHSEETTDNGTEDGT